MKRLLFIFISFLVVSTASAQKLKVNEIDKFTKTMKKETSSETLFSVNFLGNGFTHQISFTIRKTGDAINMPANILLPEMVKYTEDSGITLLLSNDETITLKTLYTGIAGTSWARGYLFDTCFSLSKGDVEKLKNNKVVSVRVNYMGGHYDRDIKKNKQDILARCLKLVDGE